MSDFALYSTVVAIWGSTWLAIKYQLGAVAPTVSIALRFAFAAAILFIIARGRGLDLRYSPSTHLWLMLHGALMYGANYLLYYLSEQTLTSGLVAVASSLMVAFNIVLLRLFFAEPVRLRIALGTACGIAGVALAFLPALRPLDLGAQKLLGLAYAVAASAIAALGNMSATRNHQNGLGLIPANAWAMLYGAALVAVIGLMRGDSFVIEATWPYLASLAYLGIFGSVIAFLCYLTLLGRIGADRAGYTSIAIPVVAMALSSLFERIEWDAWLVCGILLCAFGNLMVLGGPRRAVRLVRPAPR